MKPNVEKVKVVSNLEGLDIKMQLSQKDSAHIMELLTNAYSDPEFAALREYTTNAHESHILAGNTDPIRVKLPNNLSPTLEIQDFGVGLNTEDVIKVYSLYGASTKRDTNKVGGMLGLGSKAALTYADQFTVIGIKDGIKTIIAVTKSSEGSGNMKVIEESETDEPNGVKVTIPAKQFNQFEKKAKEFFRWWPKGSVLVNGKEPTPAPEGIKISDDITLYKRNEGVTNQHLIIQGNVPYPVDTSEFDIGMGQIVVVARVPIGTVDFPPSREALTYTNRTKKTLEKIKADVDKGRAKKVEEKVSKQPTHFDAMLAAQDFNWLGLGDAKYKGEEIPTSLHIDYDVANEEWAYFLVLQRTYSYNMRQRLTDKRESLPVAYSNLSEKYFVVGFDNKSFTKNMKARIERYFIKNNLDWEEKNIVVVQRAKIKEIDWLPKDRIIEWSEVKKVRADSTGEKSKTTWYDTIQSSGAVEQVPDDELDKTNLFYTTTVSNVRGYENKDRAQRIFNNLALFYDKPILVALAINRVNKFQKNFPKARTATEEIRRLADEWWKKIPAKDKELLAWDVEYYLKSSIDALVKHESKVKDPDLKILIKSRKKQDSLLKDTKFTKRHKLLLQHHATNGDAKPLIQRQDKVLKKYPMLKASTYSMNGEHYLDYANALHEYKYKEKV